MLVVAISDTHLPRGARRLPEACIQQIRQADLIIHAGDLTSVSFLDQLRSYGPAVYAIHGNADDAALREMLPSELIVEAGEMQVAIVHDAGPRPGREMRLVERFAGCDAVIYGHSHVPQISRHGATWILNPGSPTERRGGPCRSMLLLEFGRGRTIRPEVVRLS